MFMSTECLKNWKISFQLIFGKNIVTVFLFSWCLISTSLGNKISQHMSGQKLKNDLYQLNRSGYNSLNNFL